MANEWRLILDRASGGGWNMAVDEALLDGGTPRPVLRFYRWEEPTLSLGYFQRLADVPAELASLPLVRRSSGGGAILHDDELTYSLIVPADLAPSRSITELVAAVHRAVGELVAPGRAELAEGNPLKDAEPFLCFERRARNDLTIDGHKVLGSAQRKRSRVLLQHGSILQRRSEFAPQLPGICDLVEKDVSDELLVEGLLDRLGECWDATFSPSFLEPEERAAAEIIEVDKYGADEWTRLR